LASAAANQPSGEDALRFTLACKLRDLGFDEAAARERLHRWNEKEARYPRDPAEIDKAVTNAFRYARDEPGNRAPPDPRDVFAERIVSEPEPEPASPAQAVVRVLRERGFPAFGWTAPEAAALPEPAWLVKGAIMEEGFTLLYGPPKKGKSYAVLDLALSVVHGTRWLGEHEVRRSGTVLYLALEGHHEIMQRAAVWCRHYNVPLSEKLLVIGGVRFVDDAIVDAMRDAIACLDDLALIIVDTVARAMVGLDENVARDQSIVADRFDRLAQDAGCAVVAVHHAGKDIDRGARGSNALPAAATSSISVTMREDDVLVLKVEEIRRGRPGLTVKARALTYGDYAVWQAIADMPADPTGLEIGPNDGPVIEAMLSALCSGVDCEMISRSGFIARAEGHAPPKLRGRDFRLDVSRLLDTIPAFRECLSGDGRVALLRPEDRDRVRERVEKEHGRGP
jgi:hypothetical protein